MAPTEAAGDVLHFFVPGVGVRMQVS
jgi:hypothetical protein